MVQSALYASVLKKARCYIIYSDIGCVGMKKCMTQQLLFGIVVTYAEELELNNLRALFAISCSLSI